MDLKAIPQFKDDPSKALAFFNEYGFSIEYNVWTPEECGELKKAAQSLPDFNSTTLAPLLQMHDHNPIFRQALARKRIVQVMETLLNSKVSAVQSQFFFCRPGTHGFAMHQDNHYVEAPLNKFASAWSALEDVDASNGALLVYPRSHLLGMLEVRTNTNFVADQGQDPNAYNQDLILPPTYKEEPVIATIPMGATLFIHGQVVHSSLNNNSATRTRNALLMTYVAQGVPFRAGVRAKRREVNVYELQPL